MKHTIKNSLYSFSIFQKDILANAFKNIPILKGNLFEHLLKKYLWQFLILILILAGSFASQILPLLSKTAPQESSVDQLVPKGFVLMPIEISNGQDITDIIGSYGVVDLYAYSKITGLPETLAASALKVLPPSTEEGDFTALVPEKSAIHLFNYTEAFYAVIQNPLKTGSKIYRKQKNKSLIVIEEDF
ncbi:MAG: hypothetical protein OXN83_02650 [Oligoflexia bacterium]|nr:hypothetical protein [Oligoflexia bacterium]